MLFLDPLYANLYSFRAYVREIEVASAIEEAWLPKKKFDQRRSQGSGTSPCQGQSKPNSAKEDKVIQYKYAFTPQQTECVTLLPSWRQLLCCVLTTFQ